ncbi:N-acetylmuramoyl-L-alanine amidase, partial [Clostridium algidicarnis]|uniref:N-acetylmuramoyl-L-alanine amidase n=1 Tax=Clostridium algidicarnis TaxID=37659 RepID=UPI001C0B2397
LINKYSRLLEYEDTKQELSLTLIKVLQRIRIDKGNFREDKYIISYINKSIINRGVKTTNLYVTRYTSMPCVLVECSFVDSKQDMDKYSGNDIAEAIAKAITNSGHDSKPDLSPDLEESKELGFSYSNNAKVIGDFLYVRDSMGNIIPGRRVDIGDNITVLDVSYAKQLALVEYPTASGVKRGYVTNATNCIEYYYQDEYS